MESYLSLAQYYDDLTYDVDYEAFADFYEELFHMYGAKVESLMDLACGTGGLTMIMAQRGYRVTGVDKSADMLTEAYSKFEDYMEAGFVSNFENSMENSKENTLENNREVSRPVFVNQSLQELELGMEYDAAVCCLDGINYIPREDMAKVFSNVWENLAPGGVFIFDINSPFKFESIDGQVFIDETDDVY